MAYPRLSAQIASEVDWNAHKPAIAQEWIVCFAVFIEIMNSNWYSNSLEHNQSYGCARVGACIPVLMHLQGAWPVLA